MNSLNTSLPLPLALRLIVSPETKRTRLLRGYKGFSRRESQQRAVRGCGCRLTVSLVKKIQITNLSIWNLHPSHYYSLLTFAPVRNWNCPAITLLALAFPPACQSTLRFMIYLELDYSEAQGQHSLICHRPYHGHTQTFVLAASASLAPKEGRPLLIAIATTIQGLGFFTFFF